MNKRFRVHILFEHGKEKQPFSPSYIRLIRPLTHPTVSSILDVSHGLDLPEDRVDLVILDRLWKPDISLVLVEDLVNRIRQMDAKFLYHLDDNLFDVVVPKNRRYPPSDFKIILPYLLSQADGVLVSTTALRERLIPYTTKIEVVPNALDERLISMDARTGDLPSKNSKPVTIGYMGTNTHDADLKIIIPALRKVARRFRDRIQIEIIGVIGNRRTLWRLKGLPVNFISPRIEDIEYVRFLPWFTGNIHWDIALAPLVDTTFTRSKSDIKFLDYAAMGAAGIFSKGPVYSPTVQHLRTGWLVENRKKFWVEAIENLITDPALRQEIARNARSYLLNERILAKNSVNWVNALSHLIEIDLSDKI
jgi:glycosyltransferase involved in cell wall biosynthesis